ncbi:protein translocase subunit SecF [Moraxella catarrhalis]|uniref:protein translocase subunit SecF n=1 Tax=Moraxella catarrhalis TaxID=480 RepID=UPI000E5581D5|nr:protein translocase subunit SecF [Moraxella catarrhalis]AXT96501.1 preprotein translocase subunit SecF [Moraxella catarrhalis]MCG6832744.1 protein translocase subunit SecF [Moraxella catarrhalis]MCG6834454.1 protein translocase subunit SecF [Moraxella catarrhalis]RKL70797.1 protein translocase subunit SecF [Moraxella catarrhalis]
MNNENNPIDPNAAQPPRRRRVPRRDGKGANAATNQDALADQSLIADASDEAAEKAGGVKLIANQRIIPFMKLEKPMIVFSVLSILIGLIAIIVKGLNFGLDFTGGVSANVAYEQPVEQAQVIKALADNGFNDAVVQYLGTRQELLVRLPPQDGSAENLSASLDQILNFPNNPSTIDSISIIGSQLGNEIYLNSLLAMSVALGMMLIYVATRFQFKLALGAVLALFHDVIIVVGIFAIMGWPFDLTVLAAVLALIGYSVNDTIVVYDRIRENFRRVRGLTPRQVLDLSLTETLRRTIMTVGTVFVVVVAMLFLGGDGLYWFSVALFIGLIAGTYSSIYVASSIPLMMGLSREDFVVKVKPEFEEEVVVFADPNLQNSKD